MTQTLKRFTVVALLIAVMTSCTGLKHDAKIDTSKLDPKHEVANLASARWDALIQGDLVRAYQYLSPSSRKVMSLDLYKSKIRPGLWKKASVDSVSCERDLCKVVIAIEYSYGELKSIKSFAEESWLLENGGWWYIQPK